MDTSKTVVTNQRKPEEMMSMVFLGICIILAPAVIERVPQSLNAGEAAKIQRS